MSSYAKLFSSIVHSTVWREPDHVRLVWVTMLALSDVDGVVEASIPGLADAARVSLERCEDALDRLASPDPYSRNPAHEGRRIRAIPGGWLLLNREAYRDKQSPEEVRAKARERKRRQRERERMARGDVTPERDVTRDNRDNRAPSREVTTEEKRREEEELPRAHARTRARRLGVEEPGPPAPISAFGLLVQGYQDRYSNAQWGIWEAWDANRRQIESVQRYVERTAEAERADPARVVAELLDGAFADEWMREKRVPWKALAKDPARYRDAGRGATSSSPPAPTTEFARLKLAQNEARGRGDRAAVERIEHRLREIANESRRRKGLPVVP